MKITRTLAALAAIAGLLAAAGPAAAQTNGFVVDGPFTAKESPVPPRVNQVELQDILVEHYSGTGPSVRTPGR